MNKKNFIFIGIAVCFLIICGFGLSLYRKKNLSHEKMIESYISNTYKEKGKVEIFDTVQNKDYEIIGFDMTDSSNFGVAIIQHDGSKHFVRRCILRKMLNDRALDVYSKLVSFEDGEDNNINLFIVLNRNETLGKVQVSCDGSSPIKYNVSAPPSVMAIELPNRFKSMEYIFLDKEDNIIDK